MGKSKTALNIDKINRDLDKIADAFGVSSTEFTNYITQNNIDTTFDLAKTKSGRVHVRNTKANRTKYQKLSALAKKDTPRYIRHEQKKYKSPERKPGETAKQFKERVRTETRKKANVRYTRMLLGNKHLFGLSGNNDILSPDDDNARIERDKNLASTINGAVDIQRLNDATLQVKPGVYQNPDTGEVIDIAAIPNFNPDFLG